MGVVVGKSSGTLLIVGTGIQWAGHATAAARNAIAQAQRVFFAVADPFTARWVLELNPDAEPLPYPRDGSPRGDIYREMVARVMAAVREGAKVCAVFYGHPGVLTTPAHELVREAQEQGFAVRMHPGVSALACLFADLAVDPGHAGLQMFEATDWLTRPRSCDVHTPLVLWQVAGVGTVGAHDASCRTRIRRGLALLGEALCRVFGPAHRGILYEAAVLPTQTPRTETVALAELADAELTAMTTLYVPALGRAPLDAAMRARLETIS